MSRKGGGDAKTNRQYKPKGRSNRNWIFFWGNGRLRFYCHENIAKTVVESGSFPSCYTLDPLELSLPCQGSFYCKSRSLVFLLCFHDHLFFSSCMWAPFMTALSRPEHYLVCISMHLRVVACISLIAAAQQLYVMPGIACCVTPMTDYCAASMLTHDRSISPAVAAVEDRTMVHVRECMGVTLGNLVAKLEYGQCARYHFALFILQE